MAPPCERHRLTWKWNCRAAAQYIAVLSRAFLKAPRLASHFLAVERPSRDTRASVEEDLRALTIMASLIGHAMWLRQEQAHHLHTLNNRKGLRELERELVMRALKETGGV